MMKKGLALAAALLATLGMYAQNDLQKTISDAAQALSSAPTVEAAPEKPKYWTKTLSTSLGFENTMLASWAAGGYNTTKLNATVNGSLNYAKDMMSWVNTINMAYGFVYSGDRPFIQKNNDNIYLQSKWGYKTGANSHFNYSAIGDFRSQFTNTFNYNTPTGEDQSKEAWKANRTLKSGPLSPAYFTLSLGIDWKPKNWLSVNLAPLTGSCTVVTNNELKQAYGMELLPEYEPAEVKEGYMYKSARFQLGAQFKLNFQLSINNVITYTTQFTAFSDYLNNPLDLRTNWDNNITWMIAKAIALQVNTWLIYDPLVTIDGEQKVQFKSFAGLTLTYNLSAK